MDIVSLWKKTLQLIKGEVASASFETFFKNTVPIETDSNELTLLAPNEFAEDILRTRYLNLIESCLSQLTSNKFEIKIISASLLYSLKVLAPLIPAAEAPTTTYAINPLLPPLMLKLPLDILLHIVDNFPLLTYTYHISLLPYLLHYPSLILHKDMPLYT